MEKSKLRKIPCLLLWMLFGCLSVSAQGFKVQGTVVDAEGPVIGASVVLKENPAVGVSTDVNGNFSLQVPSANSVLVVSYVGNETQEVQAKKGAMVITLVASSTAMEDVVIVGYGQQKKASVVGAITQTTGAVLERAAGISSIGGALTGNLPGVVTTQGSGQPGDEEPEIVIRGSSSWNSSSPLVLVDGIERPMSSVDISSVQSISVLKDASATAVYGVKGANGVILVTTKRGTEGSAKIEVGFNATMKSASKLPGKFDSYDALMLRNVALEHELAVTPESWEKVMPMSFISMYRNQTTVEQRERYANVDWQKALFKDTAMSYNANINISGGTKHVNYFAALDYVNEGDLFRVYDSGRGYKSGYAYNRINVRSNLDFKITPTTTLHVNLAGSNGQKRHPYANQGDSWQEAQRWAGAYNIAPDVFLPRYSDGAWGYYPLVSNVSNSAENLSVSGVTTTTTTRINTDFSLEQDLKFITKGLRARAMVSWDNSFVEANRGINDLFHSTLRKWVDPETGAVTYHGDCTADKNTGFDWSEGIKWSTDAGYVNNGATSRNLYYQAQINYARQFGKHDVTAMGVFSRQENAWGSMIPTYREDWAFRVTYNWNGRYFIEYNGAYNGSEKFADANRFAFFNSGAVGWMISEEPFMKWFRDKRIIDMLKVRASYGEIGDDNVNGRWLYMSTWAYGGASKLDLDRESIYQWYRESAIGNPDVKWETVKKLNIGVDYSFANGLLAGSLEFFRDERVDILVNGSDRAIPSYFGGSAPIANIGKVRTKGYELELRVNKSFKDWRIWGNFNMTHARNKVLQKDDPELRPNYQRAAGYAINQSKAYIDRGFVHNFDELYGSPAHDTNDAARLPGDYYIVDFNADGIVDSKDETPYGYTGTPENTFNATIGFEWKGLSAFAQFYGVTNVTRYVALQSFGSKLNTVYDTGDWWSAVSDGDVVIPRYNASVSGYSNGTQYHYDGSYIRLKNVEVAYTFTKGWIRKAGISSLKFYVNANNLWMWTRMPDDRETNNGGFGGSVGAYPMMKRVNFGVKIIF